ncbi:MAG TPA: photosynthetic reaction center subunit H [Rubrivivax sp.]|nr:photosynthetic reaction center subunit H [Rubrivivax sp.]
MGTGAITQYVDVAQLVLYAFWIFFFGLIYYLVRENHREGYPMETDSGRGVITGWPIPEPKVFKLAHGGEAVVPNLAPSPQTLRAEPAHAWAGAPLVPTSENPMLDGVGPGAWADRADVPDLDFEGTVKIVPLRVATDFRVSSKDNDPRGLTVVGADGETGGTVVDLWVDKAESLFRYIEIELAGGARRVLLPMNFARIKKDRIVVNAILGHQFAQVPGTRSADQVTQLEEEKIMAYYGAGLLYAEPSRIDPLI